MRTPGRWSTLTPEQIRTGLRSSKAQARRLGLWEEQTWGRLEDRSSQITFSLEAPLD